MYEVTVDAGFSSGHYLRNYFGKCENPHGHNYKVRVTLAGAALDDSGLLQLLNSPVNGGPGNTERFGELRYRHPCILAQQGQQPAVKGVG